MSPTGRAPTLRKRQSLLITDLQSQLDRVAAENRNLQDAQLRAEHGIEEARAEAEAGAAAIARVKEAVTEREIQLRSKEEELVDLRSMVDEFKEEVERLTGDNEDLAIANRNLAEDVNGRYATLQEETRQKDMEIRKIRSEHAELTAGMALVVRQQIDSALEQKDQQLAEVQAELDQAREQVRQLQHQLLNSTQTEDFLKVRDDDYFDMACQQLCDHVRSWVMRFSKNSDTRQCRLTSDLRDERLETRVDNAVLDGSDVDILLADRVKRRDVFMSVVMSMIWEFVFMRYLFGLDQSQRKKLKSLEQLLTEVGPRSAVAQWRAITLTLLARRPAFISQRDQDTSAVAGEVFSTLSKLLPPPSEKSMQLQDSLQVVLRLAVALAIEMRTQRAEYIMLPPLQPEYDTHGDLKEKIRFNAALMNERSGENASNDDLEARGAVVKIVLFPLVVKKGDDSGEGEDEIVICPAQVLVARPPTGKKVVRMLSTVMDIDAPSVSAMGEGSIA
ncbi:hypothetical protein P152DRAFT_388813 [Eremomyces bilateralis CBS 781.70]|uniref:Uncharacterized protein n=1 Tax=Eremomyces bilateralis CBS 781.70 TaxID=1392243 RepID=A0A6G1GDN7_9PEZI|nr:uncharacterized protein P152DRAFT_388813 [Eremomyces bilateralis CBS 781.70]KAF1816030.1 hypothetical protein P152DRAFT_388813 [Eremomyces bilateralis CBS 781.70]